MDSPNARREFNYCWILGLIKGELNNLKLLGTEITFNLQKNESSYNFMNMGTLIECKSFSFIPV